ncbi:uncharacterized protein KY384_005357 [Bacidia gigantensis]|uniref:uncharacterized protein n=1 Tax=Bacidia gigantensis TaxID=2732470 RepID=UPI001D050852|nr:uncharacterized protein KY384_005357 [Bacidia gigantensis]KAG8529876.1 hypothetical protein KY384_005357 [Bacidia gigantensis]
MSTSSELLQYGGNDGVLYDGSHAPWYVVADSELIAVEHPYIVKNLKKGIQSLGGHNKLNALFSSTEGDRPEASLYQKPGNRFTNPIYSDNVPTRNVVLKITIPKRRGLKRKRYPDSGNSRPSTEERDPEPDSRDASYLIRGLRDNPAKYEVEALGAVTQTHRFRSLPDFAYSSSRGPFMRKMRDSILPFDYEKLKTFKFDMSQGTQPNSEIIPPPVWSHQPLPFNYAYRQNPGVVTQMGASGRLTTLNTQVTPKVQARPIPWNAPEVPRGPPAGLPPISSLEPGIQRAIGAAKVAIERRPVFTRRSLRNHIAQDDWDAVGQNVSKFLIQYVGYIFASGPWRDCIVQFGVDPRKDSKYRVYQSLMLMLDSRTNPKPLRKHSETEQEIRKESHLFDGESVSQDGKVWQVCDITDPVLSDILATQNVRVGCHESDGWYHNGTWSKTKTIMKWKTAAILQGSPTLTNAQFLRVAEGLPESLPKRGMAEFKVSYEDITALERSLVSQIKATSRASGDKGASPQLEQNDDHRSEEQEDDIELTELGLDDDDDEMGDDLDGVLASSNVVPAPDGNDSRVAATMQQLEGRKAPSTELINSNDGS